MVNIIEFFKTAMADAGMIVHESIVADGNLHRVYIEGDKRGTKNGAYILHADGRPAGWFQHFSSGTYGTWTASEKREPMTLAMRQQIEQAKLQRQVEQLQAHKVTAEKARFIWSRSTPITESSQHPYLTKKRIQPHGLRVSREALVIPIWRDDQVIVNLQFIDAEGNKRFLSGGQKKGCFAVIGTLGERLLICEGWATGASLQEHTGHCVVVALDAGNLSPVAEEWRKLSPDAEIIIMGDHDESGKGQSEARKAALAIGGRYIIPPTPGHDWNDVLTMEGV